MRTRIGQKVNAPVFVARTGMAWRGEETVLDSFIHLLVPEVEDGRTIRPAQAQVASITLEPDADLQVGGLAAGASCAGAAAHAAPRAVMKGTAVVDVMTFDFSASATAAALSELLMATVAPFIVIAWKRDLPAPAAPPQTSPTRFA